MRRRLVCAIAAVGLALSGASTEALAEEPTLSATFLGNQAIRITDGDTLLFTDFPYESGAFGYMSWDRSLLEPTPGSYCLITHRHRDHFAAELVDELGCTVLGSAEVIDRLRGGDSVILEGEASFGSITVVPVPTPHIDGHFSYRVEWGGRTLYFTGDTEVTDALAAQPPIDVLFISPWLYRTALSEGALPDVGRVYIYHHAANESVPECRSCPEGASCPICEVPRQGDALDLSR